MAVIIALLVGLIVGAILMGIFTMIHGHSVLIEASQLYKDLIDRGDAAIALLAQFKKELDASISGSGGNRVVLAKDLSSLQKMLVDVRATTEGITVVSR
jgi:hypothetical protein